MTLSLSMPRAGRLGCFEVEVGVLTLAAAIGKGLLPLPLLEGVCWSLCVGPVGRSLGDEEEDGGDSDCDGDGEDE